MIYVLGGGGKGATLTVTGVVGSSVTVSKDSKTYTKTIPSGGTVEFKGLESGTWTVKMTNGTQTATRTIEISADYSITMSFFSASIVITYPAGSTCTVKNSSGTIVASNTNTGSSAKTWTATVGAAGTYTVTATSSSDSSKTKSATVSITANGQSKSVTLAYSLYIIQNGTPTSITGGFSIGNTSDSRFVFNASGAGSVYNEETKTNNTVSRGAFTTLKFDGYISGSTGAMKYGGARVNITNTNRATASLDVSNVSSGNVTFTMTVPTSGSTLYIYNVWFE